MLFNFVYKCYLSFGCSKEQKECLPNVLWQVSMAGYGTKWEVGKGRALFLKSSCLRAQEGNKLCHAKLKKGKGDNLRHPLWHQIKLEVKSRGKKKSLIHTVPLSDPGPEQLSAVTEVIIHTSIKRWFLRYLDASRTSVEMWESQLAEQLQALKWDAH